MHDVVVDGKQAGLSVARIELGERVGQHVDENADCDDVSDGDDDVDNGNDGDAPSVTVSNYGDRIAGGYSADVASIAKGVF